MSSHISSPLAEQLVVAADLRDAVLLIVDSEASRSRLLHEVLTAVGIQVLLAESGPQAKQQLLQMPVDLVLLVLRSAGALSPPVAGRRRSYSISMPLHCALGMAASSSRGPGLAMPTWPSDRASEAWPQSRAPARKRRPRRASRLPGMSGIPGRERLRTDGPAQVSFRGLNRCGPARYADPGGAVVVVTGGCSHQASARDPARPWTPPGPRGRSARALVLLANRLTRGVDAVDVADVVEV